jgi:hypothetical protein
VIYRLLGLIALAGLNWSCSVCDAHGILQTEDKAEQLSCSAILHKAGNSEAVIEAVGARTGWDFRYRLKRGMPEGPMQITFTCGGYQSMTTKPFEWHPKVLGEYDCEPVELGTITLPKWPEPPKPAP